jgi:glycosyltransferase involved in cell wall biosynthesis
VPSVVKDGETGLLVKDAEPDAFAAAIARIAGDRELYRKFSLAARRFVAEERSLETAARVLERHLAALAPRPPQP